MDVRVSNQTTKRKNALYKSTSIPFVHKFKTENNHYIFDVNSGEILRVDEVVWQIIEDSYREKETVVAKYQYRFKAEDILRAYAEIQHGRAKDGLFSDYHPSVKVPLSKEEVARLLDTSREGLTLNVTDNCNYRCTYCPFTYNKDGTRRHRKRDMSWETAKDAIDDFLAHCKTSKAPSGFEPPVITETQAMERFKMLSTFGPRIHIGFYGGEPLLNFPVIKRLTEYVRERTKGMNVDFGLSTNGYLLKGEVADFLGTNKFNLRVSVDGPLAIHDKQRRTVNGSPTWAVVMDNVQSFIAKYPDRLPSLGATLGPTVDVHEAIRSIVKAPWIAPLQDIAVAIAIEPYPGYNQAIAGTDDFARRGELVDNYIKNLIKGRINVVLFDRELHIQYDMFGGIFRGLHTRRWGCAEAKRNSRPMSLSGQCVPGVSKLFVSADGDYLLCEKFPENKSFRFGNVSTGIDIEKAYGIFKEFFDYPREQCESCWCLPVCPIGCYASIDRTPGCSDKITKAEREKACELGRENMHKKIIAYCRILEKNSEALDFYGLDY